MKIHETVTEALLAPGDAWVWANTRDGTLGVRLTHVSEALAQNLKNEWSGSIAFWHGEYWQWEVSGQRAASFLAFHQDVAALSIVPREP